MAAQRTTRKDPNEPQWLGILEGEFDSIFRDIHESLSSLGDASDEVQALALASRTRVDTLAPAFAQLVGKVKAAAKSKLQLQVR